MINKQNQEEELSLKLLVVLTRTLESIHKRVTEDIKGLGLNPTEFAVLELIYHKGEQPIQKIGEKVLIASSSITYVVDKLEKKKPYWFHCHKNLIIQNSDLSVAVELSYLYIWFML